MMLRIDEYRLAFVAVDGISKLVTVLAGKGNYQIQYQLIFCVWVMTFNVTLAEKMNNSFDEYSTEVKSGRLEWSPVHNSEKFWRENTPRLNEKNYELLKILIYLLETSKDPLVLSVAAHDIGEYVRHYPRGKHIIEGLGGKQQVMHLLSHDDPNVRYQALLCVQKLMVHNWEYLGKQLEKETSQAIPAKG
ncbi:V-type proton ATPase subunit H like protein [Argiope bruennichi]|uniref:V-type proton ATPase subunit H like protein n=1 Tax=Argiope bruennichi TaxID=94029 RepID=A0A8T0ES76_ARGBR|nr:V-type proton ATPase subunit H like protein [Argiope bruennichi]